MFSTLNLNTVSPLYRDLGASNLLYGGPMLGSPMMCLAYPNTSNSIMPNTLNGDSLIVQNKEVEENNTLKRIGAGVVGVTLGGLLIANSKKIGKYVMGFIEKLSKGKVKWNDLMTVMYSKIAK